MDEKDVFFQQALAQKDKILDLKIKLVTTNFILGESFTLIRVKTDLTTVLKFRDIISSMSGILKVARVLITDEKEAWKWFSKKWSRLSFIDCTSFAVMKRLELEEVATFDQHFAKADFTIFK